MAKVSMRLGLALFFAFSAGAASAAERVLLAPPPVAASAKSYGPALPSAAKETKRGEIAELRARAARDGTVRVIVGYRVPFAAEGLLSQTERAQQQREIAEAARDLRRKFATASTRGEGINAFGSVPFAALEVTAAELGRLLVDPAIITIVEDGVLQPMLATSVPLIGGPAAHKLGATGAGQTVAIIDNGFQWDHPFLRDPVTGKSKIVHEIDETRGAVTGPGASNSPVTGYKHHGTAVAGIVAGSRAGLPKQQAMTGVAPEATLITIKTAFWDSEILQGLQDVYALRDRFSIAAVNMSLGDRSRSSSTACDLKNPSVSAMINNLRAAGIATVISSGNFYETYPGMIAWPACISTAVSVGAVDTVTDEVLSYSQTSPNLSLLAPSGRIASSGLGGIYITDFSGTSAAAPHVAGAFAALKSKAPKASVSQILEALQATGRPVRDNRTGRVTPRINVFNALDYLLKGAVVSTPGVEYLATGNGSGTVSFMPSGSRTSCRERCRNSYPDGTAVTITARPDPNSYLLGWSGAGGKCGEGDICSVIASSTTTAIAHFAPAGTPVGLQVGLAGNGDVTYADRSGLWRCTRTGCVFSVGLGSTTNLRALPDPGWVLASWSGLCQGKGEWCSATAGKLVNRVTAIFVPAPGGTPTYRLKFWKSGRGAGMLSATFDGSSRTCNAWYGCNLLPAAGKTVTFLAQADSNSVFAGWSGGCTGTSPTCKITITSNTEVSASFQPKSGKLAGTR